MAVTEIKKDIFWVGCIDWNLRNFHGYSLARKGTTYNAYLALDDKVTLFDTVPGHFSLDLLHQIYRVIEPSKIDYIVAHHIEPDHSGSLPELIERIKPEKIFCSPVGKQNLIDHYHREEWPYEVVKTGDSISLGRRNVRFIEARMLHWPDSMFSYIPEEKLLISNDAFGQNWASSERFDDEVDLTALLKETSHYYANIILPFSNKVQKVLKELDESEMEIEMIAPDHGLIWRSHVAEVLKAYDRYSRQETQKKAVIIYDTMWQSTEKMAKAVADSLQEEGISTRLMHIKSFHHSDVMAELIDAAAFLVASPTHNNGILPLISDALTYVKGLRPASKVAAAFGSYGWSGEAVKHLNRHLEEMTMEIVHSGVRSKYVPDHEKLAECKQLGKEVAQAIQQKFAEQKG